MRPALLQPPGQHFVRMRAVRDYAILSNDCNPACTRGVLMEPATSAIYDAHAGQWARAEPVLLSDFTARPFVIDELGPLAGTHVLDLGCGEGYVARLVADAGASSVFGVDAS